MDLSRDIISHPLGFDRLDIARAFEISTFSTSLQDLLRTKPFQELKTSESDNNYRCQFYFAIISDLFVFTSHRLQLNKYIVEETPNLAWCTRAFPILLLLESEVP
jgi:hypothetical protein